IDRAGHCVLGIGQRRTAALGGPARTPPWAKAVSHRIHLALVLLGVVVLWEGLFLYAGEEALRSPMETLQATAKLMATELFWSQFRETARAFAFALTIAVAGGISLGVWLGFHR